MKCFFSKIAHQYKNIQSVQGIFICIQTKKHKHSYIIFQKVTECEDLMDDPAMMESLKNAAKDLTADMMPVEMWDNLEVRHHLIFAF